jgi:hypothetical protein
MKGGKDKENINILPFYHNGSYFIKRFTNSFSCTVGTARGPGAEVKNSVTGGDEYFYSQQDPC